MLPANSSSLNVSLSSCASCEIAVWIQLLRLAHDLHTRGIGRSDSGDGESQRIWNCIKVKGNGSVGI